MHFFEKKTRRSPPLFLCSINVKWGVLKPREKFFDFEHFFFPFFAISPTLEPSGESRLHFFATFSMDPA